MRVSEDLTHFRGKGHKKRIVQRQIQDFIPCSGQFGFTHMCNLRSGPNIRMISKEIDTNTHTHTNTHIYLYKTKHDVSMCYNIASHIIKICSRISC